MKKKVILVIASQGYQTSEYGIPKDILEQAGHDVITVSDKSGTAQAADDSTTKINLTISEVNPTDYDGIFLIGGPGAPEHIDNEDMYKLLKAWKETGKPFGAICISPRILAKAGVLEGKRATGWNLDNGLEEIFTKHKVEYVKQGVVTDDNIVTADGPSSAEEFGKAILQVI